MTNYSAFLQDLKELLSIESVLGDNMPNAPFGEKVKKAMDFFENKAKSFGFQVINHNGFALEIIFGEGQEYGVMGHLDVVPSGNNWQTEAYSLTKKDGVFYGRGIADDKGPMLICLYALKEIKDSNLPFNAKIRMFVGGDEESGWRDAEYLQKHVALPKYGFSPDGNFPISYAEKGMAIITFKVPKLNHFDCVLGGTVVNAVCDKCDFCCDKEIEESLLKKHNVTYGDGVYTAHGKSAHGSTPQLGDNAIKHFLSLALDLGEDVQNLFDCLFLNKTGLTSLCSSEGSVTFSPNIVYQDEDSIYFKCDCRFPNPFTYEDVIEKIKLCDIEFESSLKHGVQYVEKEGEFVSTLLKAYNDCTKENGVPISQGGSTFARVFEKGVAFGPELEGVSNLIHQAGENMTEENLLKLYDIYLTAFKLLGRG